MRALSQYTASDSHNISHDGPLGSVAARSTPSAARPTAIRLPWNYRFGNRQSNAMQLCGRYGTRPQ